MSMFDDLHNAWEPIYDPGSRVKHAERVGRLPMALNAEKQEIVYGGQVYTRETWEYGVREDGPDAWGSGFTLEKGEYFRWNPRNGSLDGWYQATERSDVTVSTAGGCIETVKIEEDGTLTWALREFVAM